MGVQADDHAITRLDVRAKPFDLVRMNIGRRHFDRGGQIQNHLVVWARLPYIHHRFANLDREFQFGTGETLGRIFKFDFGVRFGGELFDSLRTFDRDFDDLLFPKRKTTRRCSSEVEL